LIKKKQKIKSSARRFWAISLPILINSSTRNPKPEAALVINASYTAQFFGAFSQYFCQLYAASIRWCFRHWEAVPTAAFYFSISYAFVIVFSHFSPKNIPFFVFKICLNQSDSANDKVIFAFEILQLQ